MAYEETPRDLTPSPSPRVALVRFHSPHIPSARVNRRRFPLSAQAIRRLPRVTPVIVHGKALPARHLANFGVTVGLPCAAVLENPAQLKCAVGVGGETTGLWGEGQDW